MPREALADQIIDAAPFRRNVFNLVPAGTSRILDFGCGPGALLLRLMRDKGCTELYGVEVNPQDAATLERLVAKVWCTNIEFADFAAEFAGFEGFFNLIILHDVLEHLYDPWFTLTKIRSLLAEGGRVIVATPNLHFWRLQHDMLTGGFPYGHGGLWHTGHLRWYTPASLVETLLVGGLSINRLYLEIPDPVDLARYSRLKSLRHFQFPPAEFQNEVPAERVVTVSYEKDIRSYVPVFHAHKLIADCGRGDLLETPAPMTYACHRLEALRRFLNLPFDIFNPPAMTPLVGNAF